MASKQFNGHRNWNAWNISLWIDNDEGLYRFALDCVRSTRSKDEAARTFMAEFSGRKTPDGAPYTLTNVRAALADME